MERSIPLTLAPPSSYNVLRFKVKQSTTDEVSSPLTSVSSSGASSTKSKFSSTPSSKGTSQAFNMGPLAGFDEEQLLTAPYKQQRKIAKVPYKVLDAPALQDDFYLNLVDWSSTNILAVGLGSCVYLWSATSSKVTKLYDLGANDSVTSVQWSQRGNLLAVGTNNGLLQIWDAVKSKMITQLSGHEGRVGSVAWNSRFLSTGSRDKSILHRDLRTKNNFEAKLAGHK